MFSPRHPHPTPQHTYSLASFRNFSLILCCLNMKCLGIDFFFLLLTTWCSWGFLDLWFDSAFVWETTWVFTIDTSGISFVSFSFCYSHCMYIIPLWLSHSSWTFWGFCFASSFSLLSSFGSSYWCTFRLADSLLHHVLSVDELIRYITHFSSLPHPICWWACLLIFCWKPGMIY